MGGAGHAAPRANLLSLGGKMTPYDTSHTPPAPMVHVTVASIVRTRRRESAPALLDTGSDITAIPTKFVDALQLYPISRLRLEDVQSKTVPVFTYAVRLTIAGLVIPRLEVILTGLEFVVIGRDVLNRFYLLLNGPDLTFDLATTSFVASP